MSTRSARRGRRTAWLAVMCGLTVWGGWAAGVAQARSSAEVDREIAQLTGRLRQLEAEQVRLGEELTTAQALFWKTYRQYISDDYQGDRIARMNKLREEAAAREQPIEDQLQANRTQRDEVERQIAELQRERMDAANEEAGLPRPPQLTPTPAPESSGLPLPPQVTDRADQEAQRACQQAAEARHAVVKAETAVEAAQREADAALKDGEYLAKDAQDAEREWLAASAAATTSAERSRADQLYKEYESAKARVRQAQRALRDALRRVTDAKRAVTARERTAAAAQKTCDAKKSRAAALR